MSARILYETIGFLVGLLFGSFLNVCILRLPRHESIIRPRSYCPDCGAPIRWRDNIPLLSWLVLARRCRDCGKSIPWRYTLVELAVAAWFAIQAARLHTVLSFYLFEVGRTALASYAAVAIISNLAVTIIGFFLIGLIVIDWQTGLLPDSFTITGTAIGFFLICIQAIFLEPTEGQILLPQNSVRLTSAGAAKDMGNVFLTGPEALVGGRMLAIFSAALVVLLIRWTYKAVRRREGMGLGDVKLLAMIAAFLGFWPAMLSLFFGALGASLYGVFQLVRGRASTGSKLAFGSFLGVAGLLVAQVGDRIVDAYSQLLR